MKYLPFLCRKGDIQKDFIGEMCNYLVFDEVFKLDNRTYIIYSTFALSSFSCTGGMSIYPARKFYTVQTLYFP